MPTLSQHDEESGPARPDLPPIHLRELQSKTLSELTSILAKISTARLPPHDRHDAILAILQRGASEQRPLVGEGVLEVLPDGFGFLRNSAYDYLPVTDDLYVSPAQIRRFHMQTGNYVTGQLRPPKGTEKYFALMHVERIDGKPAEAHRSGPRLETLAATSPHRQVRLALPSSRTTQVLDRLAPLGFGQRGLLLGERGTGQTSLLTLLARGAAANQPEALVLLLLIEALPETIGEVRGRLRDSAAEVVATCLDQSSERHVHVLDLTVERARRVAEAGRDVLVLVDSLERVARAYHLEATPGGREATPGLAAEALHRLKRLLAAARAVEAGGSLTLLASLPLATDSRLDDYLRQELAPFVSWQVQLDAGLARRGRFPAIDVRRTWSRSADRLLEPDAFQAMIGEREQLVEMDVEAAWERAFGGR